MIEIPVQEPDEPLHMDPYRELRIPAAAITALQDHLLQPDGNERIAVAHCTPSGDDLLVSEIQAVPDTALTTSTPGNCRLSNKAERRYISACTRQDKHLLLLHSHPFTDEAWFSGQDDEMMNTYRDWLTALFPETALAFGVLAQQDLRCNILADDGESFRELPVTVVGDWTLETPVTTRNHESSVRHREKYDRNIRALGTAGQNALARSHVAVVGCGGIGSQIAVQLARLGVTQLTLIDPDHVEPSNLPRLAGARHGDIGTAKVRVTQQQCLAANPEAETTTVFSTAQEAGDQLKEADVIVAGLDRITPRYWLNEFAVTHLIPYVDAGTRIDVADDGIEAVTTMIQTIAPGATACIDCLDRFDPEQARIEQLSETELDAEIDRGYINGADTDPEPAIVDVNWLAASHAVGAVKKIITGGTKPPGLLQYEDTGYDLTAMNTHPSTGCITCGADGVLGDGGWEPDLNMDEKTTTPDSERSEPENGYTEENRNKPANRPGNGLTAFLHEHWTAMHRFAGGRRNHR